MVIQIKQNIKAATYLTSTQTCGFLSRELRQTKFTLHLKNDTQRKGNLTENILFMLLIKRYVKRFLPDPSETSA